MNIILYTKTGCPWSAEVKELFSQKGVKYEERNVTENETYRDELMKKSGMVKSPTLDIDGEIFADTDREAVEELFIKRGMPGFNSYP